MGLIFLLLPGTKIQPGIPDVTIKLDCMKLQKEWHQMKPGVILSLCDQKEKLYKMKYCAKCGNTLNKRIIDQKSGGLSGIIMGHFVSEFI